MKREYAYALALIILMIATSLAQRSTVQQNIKISAEVKKDMKTFLPKKLASDVMEDVQRSDEAISKEMIRQVSARIKEYIASGQITEGTAFIQANMIKCSALKDSKLCEAGLNFHSGYLYQQAIKIYPDNIDDYQKRAINHFEKVLDVYPQNSGALNNLIKLNTARSNNFASVGRVLAYVEQLPSEADNYFIHMGNLFRSDKKFDIACDFYSKAYQKNPRSNRACDGLVTLYTKHNFSCTMGGNIREFALDCKEIGLPNYSEELLKKELALAVINNKEAKAMESMLLWANILAENNWLFPEDVTKLINQLFPKDATLSTSDELIKDALEELEFVAQAETAEAIHELKFWDGFEPYVLTSDDQERLSPNQILLKIYYAKGEKAYFKNDYHKAEDFWQAALNRAQKFDNGFFTLVASELAQLYDSQPKMDPRNKKLNALVKNLFEGKGDAYRDNDLPMIRKYHMTLGAIYYVKKKWKGGYATNARFQLKRAVSDRFGPIINPKLRKMLGDVHSNLGETQAAIDVYGQSILDYLSLDRIKEAEDLYMKIKTTKPLNDVQIKKYEAVGGIIDWRKEQTSPNNAVLKETTPLSSYLDETSKAEIKAKENLPKDFVQVQFFKGLSDLGSQLGDDRKQEQQIIYANALNKVKDGKDLSSEQDYYRVIEANNSLSQSLEDSKKLRTMQMYTKGDLTYYTEASKEEYKVYLIPSLNKEIIVPNQLFILNDQLQNDYKKTNTTDLIKYNLNKGNFELKQMGNN